LIVRFSSPSELVGETAKSSKKSKQQLSLSPLPSPAQIRASAFEMVQGRSRHPSDEGWSHSLRDDDLCGSSSSDEDGGSVPSSTRTGKAASGSAGIIRSGEEDWGHLWSDSSAPVDIGMVEEPEDLKFVDTPFTKARRNARPLPEKMSDGGESGKEKKVRPSPFSPSAPRSLFPFRPSHCCNTSKPTPAKKLTKQTRPVPSSPFSPTQHTALSPSRPSPLPPPARQKLPLPQPSYLTPSSPSIQLSSTVSKTPAPGSPFPSFSRPTLKKGAGGSAVPKSCPPQAESPKTPSQSSQPSQQTRSGIKADEATETIVLSDDDDTAGSISFSGASYQSISSLSI
jgi:hypothetical protein